jgi:hypothetical protein
MQQILALLEPGNTAIYLMAIVLGLYVQYQTARTNGRTATTTFWDYWLKETPGMSIATVVVLVTVAGGTIQSGMLTAMNAWAVFSMGFLKGFGFDALIQAPAATESKPKQAGFARVGMLALLLALMVAFSGCGLLPKTQLPDSKTLSPVANASLKAIVAARGVLDAAYDFIGTGVRTGAIEPTQGRTWFNELDTYRDKIKKAQELYDAGGFDVAKLQAEGTEALIKFIHDQALEALRKQAKPAGLVVIWQREIQPTARRLAWIRQPQD